MIRCETFILRADNWHMDDHNTTEFNGLSEFGKVTFYITCIELVSSQFHEFIHYIILITSCKYLRNWASFLGVYRDINTGRYMIKSSGLMGFDHVNNPFLYPDKHPKMISYILNYYKKAKSLQNQLV